MKNSQTRYIPDILMLGCVALFVWACAKEEGNDNSSQVPGRQIRSLLESTHTPIRMNPVTYDPEPTENSTILRRAYNRNGALVAEDLFNADGKPERKTKYAYNTKGNLKETLIYNFDGTLFRKRIHNFDSENVFVGSVEQDGSGKTVGKETFQVTSNGFRLITSYSIMGAESLRQSEQVIDLKGRVREERFFTNQQLAREEFHEYDTAGNRIVTVRHNPVTNEESMVHSRYNRQGKPVEVVLMENNVIMTRDIFKYDANHNPVEIYTYGVMGNMIQQVSHTYEYDIVGNWIRDITLVNGKPKAVKIRRLEYYE